jgi:hypothetical protein
MYLTPQHILLAGATGLTGELSARPPAQRADRHPRTRPSRANPWPTIRAWKTRSATPAVFLPQLSGRVDVAFCCLGTTHQTGRFRSSLSAP